MKWVVVFCISLQTFLMSCPALADNSLSWLDRIRYLRFGEEKLVKMAESKLDLTSLKDNEYWIIWSSSIKAN